MDNWQKTVAWHDQQSVLAEGARPPARFQAAAAMAIGAAVALVLTAIVLIFFRYEFAVGGGDAGAYRFDRWSGEATVCLPQPSNPLRLSCSGRPSDWMAVPAK